MAFRGCDWAVLGSADDYHRLKTAVDVFGMHSRIITAVEP